MARRRRLGGSGIEVSALALGSWRTFERIPRDQGIAVMRAAREVGITFLDDARYDDETGAAPLRTGWSEVVFGELFRAAGWDRDDVVVANKLWWEFWPDERAADELDGSLRRMGFDHLDVLYAAPPPAGLPVAEVVGALADLVASGRIRAWGVLNWTPAQIAEAAGDHPPCAAQLPYNLLHRSPVEDGAMRHALARAGASVVASAVLAGGTLTGKYGAGSSATGRMADRLDRPRVQRQVAAGEALSALARRWSTTPAALAVAFALAHPDVASVLFGATRPEQVTGNAAALEVLEGLDDDDLAELRRVGEPE